MNRINLIHISLIILVTTLIYLNSFQCSFHFDDKPWIVENPRIKHLSNIPEILKRMPRPLPEITFALNYYFGGLNIFGYHLVNLIIHIAVSILIYLILDLTVTGHWSLVTSQSSSTRSTPHSSLLTAYCSLPFMAALLFAVHPIQSESVTYIAGRYGTLSALLYLLSLFLFIKGMAAAKDLGAGTLIRSWGNRLYKSPHSFLLTPHYSPFTPHPSLLTPHSSPFTAHCSLLTAYSLLLGSLLSFILALASKEEAITLPLVAILYTYYFISPYKKPLDFIKHYRFLFYPLILVTLLYLMTRSLFLGGLASIIPSEKGPFTWYAYFFTQLRVIPFYYLNKLLVPRGLNIDPHIPISSSIFSPPGLLGLLIILALLSLAIRWSPLFAKISDDNASSTPYSLLLTPHCSFAILWFFITLLPSSSIIPLNDPAAEHRLYLPSFGFAWFVSILIIKIRETAAKYLSVQKISWVIIMVFMLMVLTLGFGTVKRNLVYTDELSLWSDALQKSPFKQRPHINLGSAYASGGRYAEAIEEYQKALEISSAFAYRILYNIGNAYYYMRHFSQAAKHYQLALEIKPEYPEAHNNLGATYEKMSKLDEAMRHYHKAIALKPDYAPPHRGLGFLYLNYKSDNEKALYYLRETLRLNPTQPNAQNIKKLVERLSR